MTKKKNLSGIRPEKLRLSKRLSLVASWVTKGNTVADIGTDHGYLPIYLYKNNISPRVLGMDVRKGPLQKAKKNLEIFKAEEGVELRLSDGLEKLQKGEAKTITICGMGGKLMRNILEQGIDRFDSNTQLILSPQSEIRDFREYLYSNGYEIVKEDFIKEDEKFYLIMECIKNGLVKEVISDGDKDIVAELNYRFGYRLLQSGNLALKEYIQIERNKSAKVMDIINNIEPKDEAVQKRMKEVEKDILLFDSALAMY